MKEIKAWKEIKRFERDDDWGIIYELESYRITITKRDYLPGGMDVSLRWEGRYTPEIYIGASFDEKEQHLEIQTTAYGALEPEEIKKVMAGYEMALRVAEAIKTEIPEIF